MSDEKITCCVFEGLCNRINALASAMATGRRVRLRWAINSHCPVPFEELFEPIDGVRIVNQHRHAYPYTATPRKLCWFFPRNVDDLPHQQFVDRLYAAYRQIIRAIRTKVFAAPIAPALGVIYRHHFDGSDSWIHFVKSVQAAVKELNPASVFVATDSLAHKQLLVAQLAARQAKQTVPFCSEDFAKSGQGQVKGTVPFCCEDSAKLGQGQLKGTVPFCCEDSAKLGQSPVIVNDVALLGHDQDRSRRSVHGMCQDLLSLSLCNLGVITGSTRSTVPDSSRGFGVRVYHTYDDGFHRYGGRDDAYESRSVDELIGRSTNTSPANSLTSQAMDVVQIESRGAVNVHVVDDVQALRDHFQLQKHGAILETDLDIVESERDLHDRKRLDAEVLTSIAASCPGDCLDLGTSYGRSAYELATNIGQEHTVYTDNMLPKHANEAGHWVTHVLDRQQIGAYYRDRGVRNIEQFYENTLTWNAPPRITDLSVVFIDACHDEQAVYSDSQLAWQRLRPGGFILWHDFTPIWRLKYYWIQSVMRGVARFMQSHGLQQPIVNVRNSWIGVLRK